MNAQITSCNEDAALSRLTGEEIIRTQRVAHLSEANHYQYLFTVVREFHYCGGDI